MSEKNVSPPIELETPIKQVVTSDMQATALSEFIGRNIAATSMIHNFVVSEHDTETRGIVEYVEPLYDISTRQPLELKDVKKQRDDILESNKFDSMTGAYKREQLFMQYPNGFMSNASVLAVDLAGLKLLNDYKGGHKTGDIALQSAVMSMNENIPGANVFRTGGDEFIVVVDDLVDEEIWAIVNQSYLAIFEEISGHNAGDHTFLRAGIVEPLEFGNQYKRDVAETIARADDAEVKLKALIKILGTNYGVPLISSVENIDNWLSDNRIELVDKGEKIVAYKTWAGGKRKLLPTYFSKKGSTKVRGR